jgi:4-amino-4-deoxy-L-arabinose transferase-like glycosyltransferase
MGVGRERKLALGLLLVVILIGWTFAVVDLGRKSFWADEGYTAYLAQETDAGSLAANLRKVNNPLHLLLVMGIVRVSRSEMALRFPSAMAAVLALPVVYLLGCRLSRRSTGLVAAFLLAISPFAIGYAQEARSYALFELFSALSLLLFLLALDRNRWTWWAGYALVTALALYTHFFSWFVVGAEVIFGLVLILRTTWRHRKLDRRLPGLVASLLLVGLLYIPWLPSLLSFWQQQGPGSRTLIPGLEAFRFSANFLRSLVIQYGARGGPYGFYLTIAIAVIGLASLLLRSRWRSLFLVVLWFFVPLVLLTLIPSRHFFDFRYLIFTLPVFLLLMAEGVAAVASLLARLGAIQSYAYLQPLLALGLALLLVMPANLPAFRQYYGGQKENWRGVGEFVVENIQSDEAIFVTPRYWGYTLEYYQPSLQSNVLGPSTLRTLAAAEQEYGGLWYVRFVMSFADPSGEFADWIAAREFDLLIDSAACGHGLSVYYRRLDDTAPARQSGLLDKAATFCPSDPRFAAP